ncbi:HAMP domain-containing sensor histidine kinase [Ectopseudomonas mendocina]|uniref:histidine kinase n=1 Tax=Ectopseudomonas mendocina TaxID=300 RepID=A0ABZ2REX7_ECTME
MKRQRQVRSLAFAAILIFALMLGYALYKLLNLQSEISADIGENMVWAISQSVYQSVQLERAAQVSPPTADSKSDLALHLDLLKSSLMILNQGPQLRYMQRSGVDARIRDVIFSLDHLPINYELVTRTLRQVGNTVMLAEREDAGRRREDHRRLVLQVILTVVGLLVAGSLLCWQMLRNLRMATQAKEALQLQHLQTQRLLEVLQQERSVRMRYRDFVSLMSHQLRTPLAVIDSTAQRLKRQLTDATLHEASVKERSQLIRNSVNHLNYLIGRVLEGLRLDEGVNGSDGERRLDLQPCNWLELVESSLERFGDLLHDREIRRHQDGKNTDFTVNCDKTWCIEIICNLVSNAHKYSPPGYPIEISLVRQGGHFKCAVRDYGPGVSEQEKSLIFERFYRSENNLSVAGIGLGLPIARTLAEWHGGSLEVMNAEGGGAVFTLTLPA